MSCLPHNEQVCYQLLKCSQEWTPAFFSPHYLAWNITHLLIYLVYSCFKTMTCFFVLFFVRFFFAKVPNNVPIHLLVSAPQTIRNPAPPKKIRLLLLFSSLFPFFSFFKAKSHFLCAVPLHCTCPQDTLFHLALNSFKFGAEAVFLLTYLFIYDSSQNPLHMSTLLVSLSFPVSLSFSAPHSIQYRSH